MPVCLFRVAKFCSVLQPNLRHVACSSKWGSVQPFFSLLGAKERPTEFASKMKVVRVSQPPDSDHVTLSLELGGKLKQLHRPNEEPLEKTFCRLRATLQNAEKSNKKRKHEETGNSQIENSQINMSLLNKGGEQCPLAERCDEVWKDAAMLEIHDEKYRVVYNPPTVAMIKLPQSPLAGMTLHPVLQFEFATHQFSKFAWYKSKENECNGNGKKKSNSTTQWEFISNNKLHAPSFSDVGFKFKLKVTPGSEIHPAPVNDLTSNDVTSDDVTSDDVTSDVITLEDISGPVLPARNSYLFDCRHVHTTKSCSGNTFRMVCYNILADCYATQTFARKELFPYCPDDFIKIDYRIQLIQKELEGYHGDIICLQEVDRFVFQDHLVSSMSLQNFAGALATKKHCKEGVALFYKRDRFKLISVENKVLQESLENDDVNKELLERVSRNQSFKSTVTQRGSCVLLAVLQSIEDPRRHLVVANTHLYWHPRAPNIRLVQMGIVLNLVKAKVDSMLSTDGAIVTPIICGDLNSNPTSGVCDLIRDGTLPSNHADWYAGGITNYHGGDWTLSHDMNFVNSCGSLSYTTYVTAFTGCLDYIFINPQQINVKQVVPHPPHNLVTMHTALPCVTSPSDHIAQVVDLEWA